MSNGNAPAFFVTPRDQDKCRVITMDAENALIELPDGSRKTITRANLRAEYVLRPLTNPSTREAIRAWWGGEEGTEDGDPGDESPEI